MPVRKERVLDLTRAMLTALKVELERETASSAEIALAMSDASLKARLVVWREDPVMRAQMQAYFTGEG